MRRVSRLVIAGALLLSALNIGMAGDGEVQTLRAGGERSADRTATGVAPDSHGEGDSAGTDGAGGPSASAAADASATPESGLLPAAGADLAATITGWSGSLEGQPLTYVVVVANRGPSSASGVRLTVSFSRGMIHDWSQTSQGSCAVEGSAVVCDLGDLSVGGAARVTTQITSNGVTFITGAAGVVRNESDHAPANNRASITLQRSGPTIHIHPPGTPV
jgi:hypothetical protein